jgi:uncharacterized damage-inducible protein DinB
MQPYYADYVSNLRELHQEIRGAVAGLPQEALDWTPGSETNSIGVLVVHVAGAQRYWAEDVIAGDASGRDREAEFQVCGLPADSLILRLGESEAYVRQALEGLTLPELEAARISPRSGREVTMGWAMGHALKHTALHVGQIQIMRQLWEQHRASARSQRKPGVRFAASTQGAGMPAPCPGVSHEQPGPLSGGPMTRSSLRTRI